MPPQVQALLGNRRILIAGGVLVIVVVVVLAIMFGSMNKPKAPGQEKLEPAQLQLASVDSMGRAIEIQALMAQQNIRILRESGDGGRVTLRFTEDATQEDWDRAHIALVRSGLMDRNIGLESFDQGDLMATREEKRIKLYRAIQGELSRLIRKMDGIDDASVSLSIPEETIFRKDQTPISASVQVSVPNGQRLSRDDVRAIINLMVGAVQGLDPSRVALTDTNGNTYNSMLGGHPELEDKIEEQDEYMRHKVSAQLDRLVGAGHYVVTVSTFLRQAPRETMVQTYDPAQSAVSHKQAFSETMRSQMADAGIVGGPASVNIPPGLDVPPVAIDDVDTASKAYVREAAELNYANARTQYVESSPAGTVEDISIAVTIDERHMPDMMTEELQLLLASAASPKVEPDKVSIVTSDFNAVTGGDSGSATDTVNLGSSGGMVPTGNASEGPALWVWVAGGLGGLLLLLILVAILGRMMGGGGSGDDQHTHELYRHLEDTQQQLEELRELNVQQQQQLQQTQQLMVRQAQQQQQQPRQQAQPAGVAAGTNDPNALEATLDELWQGGVPDDEQLSSGLRNWVDQGQ